MRASCRGVPSRAAPQLPEVRVANVVHDTGLRLDLDGRSLTIADAVHLARRGGRCAPAPQAAECVERTRALKHELIAREIPIYGVTTGFGDSAHRQISAANA